jgi:hypothetical protein
MGNGMVAAAPFRRSEFFGHLYQRVTLADREVRTELFRSLAEASVVNSSSREIAEVLAAVSSHLSTDFVEELQGMDIRSADVSLGKRS